MATNRAAILDQTWRLFRDGGLDAVSMRSIADGLSVTPMALYRHYPGKAELVDALVADAFTTWEARLAAIRVRDPYRWLRRAMEAYVDFALDDPRRFEAAFLLRTRTTRQFPDDFVAGQSPAFALILPRLRACMDAGRLRRAPELEVAMAMWAHSHGLIVLYCTGRFACPPDAFRALYLRSIDLLMTGLEP